jgi:hypothetical protein
MSLKAALIPVLCLVACAGDDPDPTTLTKRAVAPDFEPVTGPSGPIEPPPFASACAGYTPPTEGASCADVLAGPSPTVNWACEYGHDVDGACNDHFDCNGTWLRRTRRSCFGRCAETFAEIVPGSPCARVGHGCSYFEGTCACTADGIWRCVAPPANGCPAQRPPDGSDCVRSMTCDYGTEVLGLPLTFVCAERTWTRQAAP